MIERRPEGACEIAAVIPCLNEEENVEAIARAVVAQFEKLGLTYEIIFIDNGSTDETVPIVRGLCAQDERVRLIINNRDYGQMKSPTHAIYQATAKGAIVGISADFQDPPELIEQLVARWRAGAMIVLGVRSSEKTSFALRVIRAVGYGFFQRFGDYAVIPGATGFGLYDRRVVDCLKRWRDPEPFFRGMLVESGFGLATITYHAPERARGRSKNSLLTIFGFGLSGLASSSKNLLRLPIYVSVVAFVATALALLGAIAAGVWGRSPLPLLVVAACAGAFAMICFFLGLLGEHVRLISEIVRNTPLVIEKERVNFPMAVDSRSVTPESKAIFRT